MYWQDYCDSRLHWKRLSQQYDWTVKLQVFQYGTDRSVFPVCTGVAFFHFKAQLEETITADLRLWDILI